MTVDDARTIADWRYDGAWSVYDLDEPAAITEELDSYWALCDADDAVVGFVCTGAAARVCGLVEDPAFVDVGVGLHPGLVGTGAAAAFGDVALDHVARRHPDRRLRAVIQAWNERSLRFAIRHGFVVAGDHLAPQARCRVVIRPRTPSRDVIVAESGIWLVGERILLREFTSDDEAAMHSYASDPRVTRYADWGPNTSDDTRLYLARTIAERGDDDRPRFTLAAVEVASDQVVGSGSIVVTDDLHRRAEIGYVIHPEHWSKGYATDVARSLVRFGFEHLRMRRIAATCDPENGASARVLQKAGLVFEGRMRGHLSIRGAERDSLLFARLDGD